MTSAVMSSRSPVRSLIDRRDDRDVDDVMGRPHDVMRHDDEQHFPSLADRARASTRHVMKNGLASPTHSAHANFFRSTILQVAAEKRARKVRFYRNGDRFFSGMFYAVPQEKYRTLESLMAELTESPICDRTVLPKGVRYLFTMYGTKISSLDQLIDGEFYVCSSTHNFHKVDYPVTTMPWWNVNSTAFDQLDRSLTRSVVGGGGAGAASHVGTAEDDRDFIKPRLITVIRNGSRPRKATRILLNKKTAHSLDQVLTEITEAIKLDTGAVKKVFTMSGRQVLTLQDFFTDDDVFFAYGQERTTLDDFDLSKNEVQFVSAYSRSVRQHQSVIMKSPRTTRRSVLSSSSSSNKSLPTNEGSENVSQNGTNGGTNGLNGGHNGGHSELSGSVRNGALYRPSPPQSPRTRNMLSKKSPVLPRSKLANGRSATNGYGDDESSKKGPRELRDKYKVGGVIGEGNYAVVRECLDRASRIQFALKIIDKRKCLGRVDMIENEVSILRRIKHRNIVQLLEDYDTQDALFLVVELVTGGDLFDAISAATKYTEKDASAMISSLAAAIKYLHALNIVHRDIKPENILVQTGSSGYNKLKLGDFGLATEVTEPLLTVCGTPTYVAPEILLETGYGLKVDVWSVGVITYILLCGFAPFSNDTNNTEELFDKIISGKFTYTSPFWDEISTSAKDLIQNLLELNPDQRFSAAQLLAHPWVGDDAARDDDIHESVSSNIAELAKSSNKTSKLSKPPGVSVITRTALDKGSRYFEGRKHLEPVPVGDEVF